MEPAFKAGVNSRALARQSGQKAALWDSEPCCRPQAAVRALFHKVPTPRVTRCEGRASKGRPSRARDTCVSLAGAPEPPVRPQDYVYHTPWTLPVSSRYGCVPLKESPGTGLDALLEPGRAIT